MATIVLSAAGMAMGGSLGGSVLGLSMATIGRAAGATLGRVIDQRILGSGSDPVAVGQVDRFRLTGASEGSAIPQIFGRMRVAGQVIWSTSFTETETTTGGGGKGAPAQPQTTQFSYAVSLAVALCEGEITRVGRIWADGVEVSPHDLNMRVYLGTDKQLPDPKIEAVVGSDEAVAYRGTAYVVFEDLPLGQFGNRVPQFSFEVMKPSEDGVSPARRDIARAVNAVALIPGTGEYSLATTQVNISAEYAQQVAINVNSPSGGTDFTTSVTALDEELPNCKSVSLVVSWFGSDLRCDKCDVAPKVEQTSADGDVMPWQVAGISRSQARVVPLENGRPVYGGTPSDLSVIEAIRDLRTRDMRPMFYPFILMEQMPGNTLTDPHTNKSGQPKLPWRGRITTSRAPGVSGSPDGTAVAGVQVDTFMGTAQPSDFNFDGEVMTYTGPEAWGYRRFILHYAHLCAAAGGVSAFCIGSEMVALTQIRGAGNSFPAVDALIQLTADVRAILGPDTKLSYAADWSEYHGYQPVGTADKFFHLDPLWADPNIDFIGIDNYMPLSDWRDGTDHRDANWGSIYNLDYLKSNVAGGEGFDWYYHSPEARDAQIRTPITDGDGETWVWRYKDLIGWWGNPHHNRQSGARVASASAWVPQSKPIWFTEFGCAAIDKGTNQPNKFLDPKSSESQLPYYSNGIRDETMQMHYLRATYDHYDDPVNNPVVDTPRYRGPMLDMSRAHVWCWDARPYPFFPGNDALWSDGDNYARGHWLNGRGSSRTLADTVGQICASAGLFNIDTSCLFGTVRGYVVDRVQSARASLQPLMLAYGVEVAERDGRLVFENRSGLAKARLGAGQLAFDPERQTEVVHTRTPEAEIAGRVQVGFITADGDYDVGLAEHIKPGDETAGIARSEFALTLTRAEGARIAARWLHESQVAQDTVTFALPPSQGHLGAGDVVELSTATPAGLYRIDRVESAGLQLAEATRVDPEIYRPQRQLEEGARLKPFVGPTPIEALFLDLPLLTGDEVSHEPHVAAAANPWPGGMALYSAPEDSGYVLQEIIRSPSTLGVAQTHLEKGPAALWDRQDGFVVKLVRGSLSSVSQSAVLGGANALAIGDGTPDFWEVLQFQTAELIAPRTYRLKNLLRGRAGTSTFIGERWIAGSKVVLLDQRLRQISIPTASRGNLRHYRYGPVKSRVGDRSFRHQELAFKGNGDRPFPVAHVRVAPSGGNFDATWVRQTRIGGDQWGRGEVPLAEEREAYVVQIRQGELILHEETVNQPNWRYSAAQRAADVGSADFAIAVAQLSSRYGTGPFVIVNARDAV